MVRFRAHGTSSQGQQHVALLTFFHSPVHQVHTDILAPHTLLNPGGVYGTVREKGESTTSFPFYKRDFSGQGYLREKCLVLDAFQECFGGGKE